MRKGFSLVLIVALLLSFAVGIVSSTVEAKVTKCIATCDQVMGYYWVCCPDGDGGWNCFWGDPC